jgi:hypothetical protein
MAKKNDFLFLSFMFILTTVLVSTLLVMVVSASNPNSTPVIPPILDVFDTPNYQNFYGINWRGTACENVAYAKSMGYEYVAYEEGMQNCPMAKNIYFLIENPEKTAHMPYWEIRTDKSYTAEQKAEINNMFVWKSNDAFPNNLATGWWFSSVSFRPNLDFQRKEIIDMAVKRSVQNAFAKENKANNFLFGGWVWDVPDLRGDFWTKKQSDGGKIVDLSYWNSNGI